MFDGLKESVSNAWDNAVSQVNEFRDRAAQALGTAKNAVSNIVDNSESILDKTLPTALAACASLQYRGTQGSFVSFMTPWYLRTRYINIEENRSARIGYPLHSERVLSTLSGFCLCEGAKITISTADISECTAIETMLNSGVFLE